VRQNRVKESFLRYTLTCLPPDVVSRRRTLKKCISGAHVIGIFYRYLFHSTEDDAASEYFISGIEDHLNEVEDLESFMNSI
jgi:hypothetical protein